MSNDLISIKIVNAFDLIEEVLEHIQNPSIKSLLESSQRRLNDALWEIANEATLQTV